VCVFVCVCNNVYAHDCYTEGCRRSVVGGEGVQVLYMPAGLIKRVMILSPTTSFQKSYNACTLSAVCPVVIPSHPPPRRRNASCSVFASSSRFAPPRHRSSIRDRRGCLSPFLGGGCVHRL